MVGREQVSAVGIGAAGFVAVDRATVVFAPHLSWRNEPLRDALAQRTPLPITVDNDANAAAWAEATFGAARGESHVVMITLGTGIGGGLIHRRPGPARPARDRRRVRPHAIVPNGARCECGNRGCWEQYASGNALVREARSMIAAGSPSSATCDPSRWRPLGAHGPFITEAARDGDLTAPRAARRHRRWLGIGMANVRRVRPRALRRRRRGQRGRRDAHGPAREAFRRQLTGRGYRPRRASCERSSAATRVSSAPRSSPASTDDRRGRARSGHVLRVMSYNLRDFLDDRHAAARVVRAVDPDVLCLQEVPRRLTTEVRLPPFARECGLLWSRRRRGSGGRRPRRPPGSVYAATTTRLPVRFPTGPGGMPLRPQPPGLAAAHRRERPPQPPGTNGNGIPTGCWPTSR